MSKKAVVLSSGGIDSTTAMVIAKAEGYEIYSLSFNYGQRHSFELKKASEVAKFFNAKEHLIIDIDLRKIGGSALTSDIEVPKYRSQKSEVRSQNIKIKDSRLSTIDYRLFLSPMSLQEIQSFYPSLLLGLRCLRLRIFLLGQMQLTTAAILTAGLNI